jgi:paraquat-inducible protein A
MPIAVIRHDLIVCAQCDLLHRRTELTLGSHAHCLRCHAPLCAATPPSFDTPLALALSGLVMLVVAHVNPVFGIDLQGHTQSASLWEAAVTLYAQGAWLLSLLVLLTTLVFPAVQLLAMCYLLLPLRKGRIAPGFAHTVRTLRAVKPWVMVEVFMLGVCVAVVKLASLADIMPSAGLWSFATLMLLLAATTASLDHHSLWLARDQLMQGDQPVTSPNLAKSP